MVASRFKSSAFNPHRLKASAQKNFSCLPLHLVLLIRSFGVLPLFSPTQPLFEAVEYLREHSEPEPPGRELGS
ncbi:hypothetical protein DL98DRAFT_511647 [Cadophora sp. DSE1049]|nr:hypothetical protein DL98DRAFT_511647 [Cadophora sp. DSE1049]